MKYISYFIFAAFIVVTLLFLRNALKPSDEPLLITGVEKCGECHKLKMLGNQLEVWQNSAHAKAYKSLLSEKASEFTAKNNLELPADNKVCLKCHTTEHFLKDFDKQPGYKTDEGVGCEACHGAGSKYSPAELHKEEEQFKKFGGIVGSEETCLKCHSPKGNKEQKVMENVCPFQLEDFVYKPALEKIKHLVNKDNF
ncbi:MAG: cytochrome c family protein [Chlorobi bacterium]|nr:cytochrome c family protein [Chlorobiota bacterium]MCI0717054.1 cytochrome c family protein [Chlorobiota bacterium]